MTVLLINKKSSAVINSFGAELKSYQTDLETELMWEGNPKIWGKTSPVLFPAIGSVMNNKTKINGTEYEMKKHGFARDMDFEFIEADSSKTKAVFVLKSTDETKANYPFDFEFRITYILNRDSLDIKYMVKNNSESNMPFCIGGHPAFAVANLNDYRLEFSEKETADTPVMDLHTRLFQNGNRIHRLKEQSTFRLNYHMFNNDVVYFDKIKSKAVSMLNSDNRGVKVEYRGFNSLGLWTPAGMKAGFLCIEPWCGCDDYDDDDGIFEHKKDIQILKCGETSIYSINISEI